MHTLCLVSNINITNTNNYFIDTPSMDTTSTKRKQPSTPSKPPRPTPSSKPPSSLNKGEKARELELLLLSGGSDSGGKSPKAPTHKPRPPPVADSFLKKKAKLSMEEAVSAQAEALKEAAPLPDSSPDVEETTPPSQPPTPLITPLTARIPKKAPNPAKEKEKQKEAEQETLVAKEFEMLEDLFATSMDHPNRSHQCSCPLSLICLRPVDNQWQQL